MEGEGQEGERNPCEVASQGGGGGRERARRRGGGGFDSGIGRMVKKSSNGEEAKSPVEKMRRKTHLPRDWQGLIRLPWLENFYETLYASNERGIYIPYTVVFQYRRIYAAYFTDSDGYVQKIDKIADLGPEQVKQNKLSPPLLLLLRLLLRTSLPLVLQLLQSIRRGPPGAQRNSTAMASLTSL